MEYGSRLRALHKAITQIQPAAAFTPLYLLEDLLTERLEDAVSVACFHLSNKLINFGTLRLDAALAQALFKLTSVHLTILILRDSFAQVLLLGRLEALRLRQRDTLLVSRKCSSLCIRATKLLISQ